ncbi:hypothetical protein FGO68_gene838 [Halteria grandinella]|uniref:Uncharacterized protein n=1 Tax=Halteria grandinella TaxID=5974 RepID=A0A8J8P3I8_HALGN|nr:hypothetical protein FGO68_gene838 [Halteria grandinella]
MLTNDLGLTKYINYSRRGYSGGAQSDLQSSNFSPSPSQASSILVASHSQICHLNHMECNLTFIFRLYCWRACLPPQLSSTSQL